MLFEKKRIVNAPPEGNLFARAEEYKIYKDDNNKKRVVFLLKIPLNGSDMAYIEASMPLKRKVLHNFSRSTYRLGRVPKKKKKLDVFIDAYCLIKVKHVREGDDTKYIVEDFLDYDLRSKHSNIINADYVPWYVLSDYYYED